MRIESDDDRFYREAKKEIQNEKNWEWYALSVRKRQALRAIILHEEWLDEWGEEPLDEEDPDYPTLTDLVKAKEYLKELNACYDGWGNKYYWIKGRAYLDADGRIPIDLQIENNEQKKLQQEPQKKERLFELEKQILENLKLVVIDGMLVYKYLEEENYYSYLLDAMLYVEIRRCLEIDLQPATLKKLADLIKSNPDIQHKADEFNCNPMQLNWAKMAFLILAKAKLGFYHIILRLCSPIALTPNFCQSRKMQMYGISTAERRFPKKPSFTSNYWKNLWGRFIVTTCAVNACSWE